MKYTKSLIEILLITAVVLCLAACGNDKDNSVDSGKDQPGNSNAVVSQNGDKNTDKSGSYTGSKKTHEPNNYNNNGYTNIMETEYGYYFNQGYFPDFSNSVYRGNAGVTPDRLMNLKYFDKESGLSVPLCNKPECEHLGDEGCVATYKNLCVINTVLYENYIYVYGVEQIDKEYKFNLYRVPLDGSSIDIVGTVFEDRQIKDTGVYDRPNFVPQQYYYFIIHKGYAYLPYYFRDGESMYGFKGGGLKRMDIDTGAMEDIYTLQMGNDAFPCNLYAIGDEVYMYFMRNINSSYWMSYNINTKEVDYTGWEKAYGEKYDITLKKNIYLYNPIAENEKYGFDLNRVIVDEEKKKAFENGEIKYDELDDDDVKYGIIVYEKYSLDAVGDKAIVTDVKKGEINENSLQIIMVTDDMLFFICNKKILIYSLKEEEWGKNIGVFIFEDEYVTERDERKNNSSNYDEGYRLTGGKLYFTQLYDDTGIHDRFIYYYACPIDSIIKGEGKWDLVYLYERGVD